MTTKRADAITCLDSPKNAGPNYPRLQHDHGASAGIAGDDRRRIGVEDNRERKDNDSLKPASQFRSTRAEIYFITHGSREEL